MAGKPTESLPPSAAAIAAGVDHVRLLYVYLNAGELDSCASLLQADSSEDAVRMLRALPRGIHEVRTVEPGDQTVTVTGRYTDATGTVDFTHEFTLSACGLIHSHHRVLP